jgi:ketosteroid isomerase-like protein
VSRPEYYGNPAGVTDDLEVVRAIYAAFARRDIAGALPFIAPDWELHAAGTAGAVGRGAPYRGHAGVRAYFADVAAVWDELVLHAEDFRVVPGSVIVIGHVTAVRGAERMYRSVVWTWRLRDGLATSVRVSDLGPLETPEVAGQPD